MTAWALDLFDFRQRLQSTRLVIAIVISIAVTPILTFLTYRLAPVTLTFAMLAAFNLAFVYVLVRSANSLKLRTLTREQWMALLAAGGWSALAFLSLTDLQWGNRLYNNTASYDLTTRVAIVNAISRSGVPPINASYFPGHPVLLAYVYYFWYVPGSLVDQLGGSLVDAHASMIASSAWCGIALIAAIGLYLRIRNPESGAEAWKTALLGSGLLLVSGLDIIAVVTRVTALAPYHGDLEHWNEQITAWVGSLLWVPHHIAALIACLAAVMLVQWMRGRPTPSQLKAAAVAALALASAIGLSVYVTLVFVLFWGIWIITSFVLGERRIGLWMVAIGVVAVGAASPFLIGLVGSSGSSGASALPLVFDVRPFDAIMPFIGNYPVWLVKLLFLLLLPVNYLMELGFFFVAALIWAQAHGDGEWKRNQFHLAEVTLFGATLFVGSFVRSTVIGSNDLGWRAWLPGQLVLLIWGVDTLRAIFPGGLRSTLFDTPQSRRLGLEIKALLLLGLLTSAADLVLLRAWPLLEDAGAAEPYYKECRDLQQGQRTYAARQAYDYINTHTPMSVVVESNPADPLNIPIGLYVNRQIAVSAHTAYGVSPAEFAARADAVGRIFQETDWHAIDLSCAQYSIDLIVVRDLDTMWQHMPALAAKRAPLYQNAYYVVERCGNFALP